MNILIRNLDFLSRATIFPQSSTSLLWVFRFLWGCHFQHNVRDTCGFHLAKSMPSTSMAPGSYDMLGQTSGLQDECSTALEIGNGKVKLPWNRKTHLFNHKGSDMFVLKHIKSWWSTKNKDLLNTSFRITCLFSFVVILLTLSTVVNHEPHSSKDVSFDRRGIYFDQSLDIIVRTFSINPFTANESFHLVATTIQLECEKSFLTWSVAAKTSLFL